MDPPSATEGLASRWFGPHLHYTERTRRSLAPTLEVRPRFVVLERGNDLGRLLTRHVDGVEVAQVSSLDEATEELERAPGVALLVNAASVGTELERLSGSEALPPGTPAIICTIPGIHEAAGGLGASDYLVKPVSRESLLAALDGLDQQVQTILAVDDEPEALQLFRRMLTSADRGYRVYGAVDGIQAMSILKERPCDVVLLDLVMPNMDGFQFLAAKSQDPLVSGIPVIVISARDPAGQPIVCSSLAVTCRDGISIGKLLSCIEAISHLLSTAGQAARPAPRAEPAAGPALA